VRYELDFYIPEDDILHSQSSKNLKSYNGKFPWMIWTLLHHSRLKGEPSEAPVRCILWAQLRSRWNLVSEWILTSLLSTLASTSRRSILHPTSSAVKQISSSLSYSSFRSGYQSNWMSSSLPSPMLRGRMPIVLYNALGLTDWPLENEFESDYFVTEFNRNWKETKLYKMFSAFQYCINSEEWCLLGCYAV
jgi:hypothetical protein